MTRASIALFVFIVFGLGPAQAMCEIELTKLKQLMNASNIKTAVSYLEQFANSGDAIAQFFLAELTLEGYNTGLDDPAVASLMKQAAQSGSAQAQFAYGAMLDKGIGVRQDLPAAFSWYEMSANQGNAQAVFNLANMYEYGVVASENKFKALSYYIAIAGVSEGNLGEKAKAAIKRLSPTFSQEDFLRAISEAKLLSEKSSEARKALDDWLATQKCR